jgi:glutamine phosphoribosylpyrophosphate amidotransferase
MNESLFGFRNPTENTLKCFQVLHDVLAKENTRLELGICTLQNESIEYHYSLDVSKLLSNWQPINGLGIAFFRPTPIDSLLNCVMPIYSLGHIAVACIGVIDNLFEIREKLIFFRYRFHYKNNAVETLSLLFHHYLEFCFFLPVEAMQVMMKKLRGRFTLMVLIADGKWLMVGCHDYPLAVGRNNETVYFGTEPSTLVQFSPSIRSVGDDPKPKIFCTTLSQSEILTPDPL